ncbi:helix-turn-helix domain-containing protein [Rossellomorea aquimaris]|uniref:helix-turn-helix domain-containing protein n=1 Tax=Rossellomorea aquimaris TaxID=189382 RepID=UPI001CD7A422|nr:helix-turn-helix domain-containing protein [Rossellomorea aquimaris]MCA1055138.1 helix-turn-helix domain-containing protein [Rossellomorea aquimaris]
MVGDVLKHYRDVRGITINELSHLAGISKSYISSIERGIQKNPSIRVLQKLADTLEISLSQLLEFRTEETVIDEEWLQLVQRAIEEGLTKHEFLEYIQYIHFRRSQVSEK